MNKGLYVEIGETANDAVIEHNGQPVRGVLSIEAKVQAQGKTKINVRLFSDRLKVGTKDFDFVVCHPVSGKLARVKRIEFEDDQTFIPEDYRKGAR